VRGTNARAHMFILSSLPFVMKRPKSLSPRKRGFDSFRAHKIFIGSDMKKKITTARGDFLQGRRFWSAILVCLKKLVNHQGNFQGIFNARAWSFLDHVLGRHKNVFVYPCRDDDFLAERIHRPVFWAAGIQL